MPAYKDEKKNTWFASFYYEDWTGERKKKVKRGFKTRREAKDWEQSFLENKAGTMEMTFSEFYDLYSEDDTTLGAQKTTSFKRRFCHTSVRKECAI